MEPQTDLAKILGTSLYSSGGVVVTVGSALTAVVILVVAWVVARLFDRALAATIRRRLPDRPDTFVTARRLIRYLVFMVGVAIALEFLGLNISSLFTAGAIFAVGIGFAMQNIAQNFVSGIILMAERTIKPGDVLEVEGRRVRIEHMGIRSTIARATDDQELIIPNSILVQSVVANQSLNDPLLRVMCNVGVSYDSDMAQVRQVLESVAEAQRVATVKRGPTIFMVEFGDSSVVWEVSIWIDTPWDLKVYKSVFLEAIWFGLKDAGIVIAYPQLDVHMVPPLSSAAP